MPRAGVEFIEPFAPLKDELGHRAHFQKCLLFGGEPTYLHAPFSGGGSLKSF